MFMVDASSLFLNCISAALQYPCCRGLLRYGGKNVESIFRTEFICNIFRFACHDTFRRIRYVRKGETRKKARGVDQ